MNRRYNKGPSHDYYRNPERYDILTIEIDGRIVERIQEIEADGWTQLGAVTVTQRIGNRFSSYYCVNFVRLKNLPEVTDGEG